MAKGLATKSEVQILRALAADPAKASATQTAYFDLMAHDLTVADACDALWHWIAEGRPVTRTTMHGKNAGEPAFEIWPRLAGQKFYCKFLVKGNPLLQQLMLVVSAHPDHPDGPARGRQP